MLMWSLTVEVNDVPFGLLEGLVGTLWPV